MRERTVRDERARDDEREHSESRAPGRARRTRTTQSPGRPVKPVSRGDDRYRAGARRTSGEPLRASWRPGPPSTANRDRRNRRGLGRLVRTYGWRIYALPILMVLTVLVAVDTANTGENSGKQDSSSVAGEDTGPQATEKPGKPVDLNIPTAKLPDGPDFTQAGKGTWHGVPGHGPKIGNSGEEFTYAVEVEDGLDPISFGGDEFFARMVDGTLANKQSWTGDGTVSLRRVEPGDNPDFTVSLTSPATSKRPDVCGFSIPYPTSCWRSSEERVVINLARWVRGAEAFGDDMLLYRQYAINHEVGHALGNNHVGCGKEGALAPVMMQQTFGVSNDYVAKLNTVDPANRDAVPKDGKTCRPNAWPMPDSQPSG